MLKSKDYVFVLWSDGFDEITATAFVTELREVGLLVKVVGLTPRQLSGAHGLALIPDLTLDQALPLAAQATCVILPSATGRGEHLLNDPRLLHFFEQASSNGAKFVIGRWPESDAAGLKLPVFAAGQVMIYPKTEHIVSFARELAGQLSRKPL